MSLLNWFRRSAFLGLLCLAAGAAQSQQSQTCPAGYPRSTPDSDFADAGNGAVRHIPTGLVWKRCAEGQTWTGTCTGSAAAYTWQAAFQRADAVNAGAPDTQNAGFTDWRVPNIKELRAIRELGCISPSINATQFPATPAPGFWSGSPFAGYSDGAWGVVFYDGYDYWYYRNSAFQVRLVRAGQYFYNFDAGGGGTNPTPQTITFGAAPSIAAGGAGTVSAAASSGLPVTFGSQTTGTCTVSGSTVTGVDAGICTIAADQAGDSTYAPAPQAVQSFSIGGRTVVPPGPPTISSITAGSGSATLNFSPPSDTGGAQLASYTASCAAGGRPTRGATGSGSPLTVRNLAGNVAYQCTVTATNGGGFAGAASAPVTVTPAPAKKGALGGILMLLLDDTVSPAGTTAQTIAFGAGPSGIAAGGTGTVSATASSGLPVTFTSGTIPVCTVSGSTVTGVSPGTCTIAANQAGNAAYSAAPQVTQSFTVSGGGGGSPGSCTTAAYNADLGTLSIERTMPQAPVAAEGVRSYKFTVPTVTTGSVGPIFSWDFNFEGTTIAAPALKQLSVSKCPADFTNYEPGCYSPTSQDLNIALPTTPNRTCKVTPGSTYYFNIRATTPGEYGVFMVVLPNTVW